MTWLILGAYEGKEGIEIVFENQLTKAKISRVFDASPRPNTFVGTPIHKVWVEDPEEYNFDPKHFLGRFTGLISGKAKPNRERKNENS